MTVLEFLQNTIFAPQQGMMNVALIGATIALSVFLLFMLSSTPPAARRKIIALATFVAGGFYVAEFFLPAYATYMIDGHELKGNPFSPWLTPVGAGMQVIGTFAILLGVINLTMIHGRNIARKSGRWGNSVVLLVSLYGSFLLGMWKQYAPDFPSAVTYDFPTSGRHLTLAQTAWDFVFNGMLNPLDATMFSLLAFFITSAAFRAFRMRSVEATLLMATAFIVMFGMVPFGQWLTGVAVDSVAGFTGWPAEGVLDSFRAQNLQNWVMKIINTPVQRGILIGYQVGMVAMALRVWLNLEKGSYFDSA